MFVFVFVFLFFFVFVFVFVFCILYLHHPYIYHSTAELLLCLYENMMTVILMIILIMMNDEKWVGLYNDTGKHTLGKSTEAIDCDDDDKSERRD